MTAVFLQGDARSVLAGLPSDFFHCAVTSPPYFGLRKYEGGEETWDEDGDCVHGWGDTISRVGSVYREDKGTYADAPVRPKVATVNTATSGNFCRLCGAWKGQLGAEPTPELYISHLVQICREVKRVLRTDGVFWLNIGDSWAANWRGSNSDNSSVKQLSNRGTVAFMGQQMKHPTKSLDMVLIPSQLALALRTDGWYVRSMVAWSKNNPMPESVNGWRWERHKVKVGDKGRGREPWRAGANETPQQDHAPDGSFQASAVWQDCPGCPKCSPKDGYVLRKGSWRPTDSYEFILMLAKTGNYYCDREAVLEQATWSSIPSKRYKSHAPKGSERPGGNRKLDEPDPSGRNLRSVWEFPTKPGKFNHYAAYPPRLPELCIKSSTSEKGCCPKCGSPWARVIERRRPSNAGQSDSVLVGKAAEYREIGKEIWGGNQMSRSLSTIYSEALATTTETVGWRPTCSCPPVDPIPCRVLDPFSGAGTTALVAEQLGLDSFSIDTSAEYIQFSKDRLADDEQKRIAEFIKRAKSRKIPDTPTP